MPAIAHPPAHWFAYCAKIHYLDKCPRWLGKLHLKLFYCKTLMRHRQWWPYDSRNTTAKQLHPNRFFLQPWTKAGCSGSRVSLPLPQPTTYQRTFSFLPVLVTLVAQCSSRVFISRVTWSTRDAVQKNIKNTIFHGIWWNSAIFCKICLACSTCPCITACTSEASHAQDTLHVCASHRF